VTSSILSAPADGASGFRERTAKEVAARPLGYLAQAAREYPGLWRQMDAYRARPGEVGGWPRWCFLPAAAACEAALALGRNIDAFETAELSTLFSWRATQGAYRFDPTIFEELWATPITGNIPVEALERLPEWCCYVSFPQPRQVGAADNTAEVAGFFVQLQYDFESHARDLLFVLDVTRPDGSTYLAPTLLRLVGNLEESCKAALDRMRQSIEEDDGVALGFSTRERPWLIC
jgi:hypothetical protein